MVPYEILDSRFRPCVLPNAPLLRLADGFGWLEGPVWFADHECLIFSDLPNDRLGCWTETGGARVWRSPSGFTNGNTRDRQGRLISCSHRDRCVTRTEWDGRVTVLADRCESKRLNAPNDVVCRSDGTIWFTDPRYGRRLGRGETFDRITPGHADGLRLDEDGNLWCGAADGVHCIAPDGTKLGLIKVPHPGRNRCRLFICGGPSLFAIYTNQRGAARP